MKVKAKICKECGKSFMPYSSLDKYCSIGCKKKGEVKKEKEKKAKIREKKKVSISTLSKIADKLWSEYIRKSAGKCEYCGTTENLNAHHIFTRHSKNMRWEANNGISLCAKHHTFSDEFSAHKTPVEFTYWLEDKRGKEYLDNLRLQAGGLLKITPEYLQEKIEYYKLKLKEYEKK